MSVTVTGTVSPVVANQCVCAYPTDYPLTNIAGANLTNPGIITALTDNSGNYSMVLPPSTAMTIAEPDRDPYTGTTPASGSYTTASLKAGNGWTGG